MATLAPDAPFRPPPPNPQDSGRGRNATWRILQFWLQNIFCFWLGYRARNVETVAELHGGLILANHQSYLDPLLLGLPLQRPISFLARDSLFRIPVIGWVLRSTYALPINRDAPTTASLREMLKRMDAGYLVGIFPEGTRTRDGLVGEFKPGFLAVLRRTKQPVIPAGIAGAFHAFPRGALWIWPRRVRVVYGHPIFPAELARFGKQDDAALTAFLRERVVACTAEATEWAQPS